MTIPGRAGLRGLYREGQGGKVGKVGKVVGWGSLTAGEATHHAAAESA